MNQFNSRWTPELDAKLEALLASGATHKAIGIELGVSMGSIAGRLKRIREKAGRAPVPRTSAQSNGIACNVAPLSRGCRWIASHIHAPFFKDGRDPFCGKPTRPGRSYCDKHHSRCYRVAPAPAIAAE
jgi:hypothetical protein